MKDFKSHFVFSRSEQNGIFLLIGIIIVLQSIYFFVYFSNNSVPNKQEEEILVRLQQKIDSAKLAATAADTVKIFPFNPNFITDHKGYTLGMSLAEIDKLHKFREGDNWVNSAEEFQKVTGISDSLLREISPYFNFPEWVTSRSKNITRAAPALVEKSQVQKQDLNSATVEELMKVKGIGETLSARIVNYRNKIGGFVDNLQLKDVYGLSYEVREEILKDFTVQSPPPIKLLNINEATVLELSSVPYINYELAREIVNYRMLHEEIHSFEELAKIKEFPSEKIDRIALYLTLN